MATVDASPHDVKQVRELRVVQTGLRPQSGQLFQYRSMLDQSRGPARIPAFTDLAGFDRIRPDVLGPLLADCARRRPCGRPS